MHFLGTNSMNTKEVERNQLDLENEFVTLIQRNEGIIYKVTGLYSNTLEEEQDLKQEILLQAWKSFLRFRKDAKFSTWLYKLSLNVALNQLKKQKQKINTDYGIIANDQMFEKNYDDNHELLFYLIKQLNEVDRMMMTLYLEGYGNLEIAEITGITANNVNVKIHRIKQNIIQQFKKLNHG